jgi:hypothetical protein
VEAWRVERMSRSTSSGAAGRRRRLLQVGNGMGNQRGLGLGAHAQYIRMKGARWACVGWRHGGLLSLFGPRDVRRHMLGFRVCIYFGSFGSSVHVGVKTEAKVENRSTQNWKPKTNRKTEKTGISVRFSVFAGNAHPTHLLPCWLQAHAESSVPFRCLLGLGIFH